MSLPLYVSIATVALNLKDGFLEHPLGLKFRPGFLSYALLKGPLVLILLMRHIRCLLQIETLSNKQSFLKGGAVIINWFKLRDDNILHLNENAKIYILSA